MNKKRKLKSVGKCFLYIGYSLLMNLIGIGVYFLIIHNSKLGAKEIEEIAMISAAYHLLFCLVIIINFLIIGNELKELEFQENFDSEVLNFQTGHKMNNLNLIKPAESFETNAYPFLMSEISLIKNSLSDEEKKLVSEIIISYCKNYSISKDLNISNPNLSRKILKKEINLDLIERLFEINKGNKEFIDGFETYLKSNLK
jgi:hypothetical protein